MSFRKMTYYRWMVQNIDKIVDIVRKHGLSSNEFREATKEGFKYVDGPKDIAKCRELIESRVGKV